MTRLRELREFHDLTRVQCAKIGYISNKSYTRYEDGERIMPLDTAVYYARYYKVSLDYLAGLTDNPSPYPPTNNIDHTDNPRDVKIDPKLCSAIKQLSERRQKELAEILNMFRK